MLLDTHSSLRSGKKQILPPYINKGTQFELNLIDTVGTASGRISDNLH